MIVGGKTCFERMKVFRDDDPRIMSRQRSSLKIENLVLRRTRTLGFRMCGSCISLGHNEIPFGHLVQ